MGGDFTHLKLFSRWTAFIKAPTKSGNLIKKKSKKKFYSQVLVKKLSFQFSLETSSSYFLTLFIHILQRALPITHCSGLFLWHRRMLTMSHQTSISFNDEWPLEELNQFERKPAKEKFTIFPVTISFYIDSSLLFRPRRQTKFTTG